MSNNNTNDSEFKKLSKTVQKELFADLNQTTLYEKELLQKIKYKYLLTDNRFKKLSIPLVEKELQEKRIYLFTITAFKKFYYKKYLWDPIIEFLESCFLTLQKNMTIFEFLSHILSKHKISDQMFYMIEEQILQYCMKKFVLQGKHTIITVQNFSDEARDYIQKKNNLEKKINMWNEKQKIEALKLIRAGRLHL